MFDSLNYNLFGNSLLKYLIALIIFIIVLKLLYYFKSKIIKKLETIAQKTETKYDDLLIEIIKSIRWFEYQFLSFYIAIKTLDIGYKTSFLLKLVLLIIITYRILASIEKLISFIFEEISGSEYKSSLNTIKIILRIFLSIVAILFILHNIGINITSLLTGLGIGGVAVALASQNILGDLFNFFVIILDKPFNIGEFIVLPNLNISGTIEEVGLKSTKIRTLQGEVVIITNSKIMSEVIQNFSRLKERRVINTIGVIYETPEEKLKLIPDIIKQSIEKFENTRFDRSNLLKFNNYSIDFEYVYYILSPDYNYYMELNEKILLEIAKKFKENNIEFAYPTQKLYLSKGG